MIDGRPARAITLGTDARARSGIALHRYRLDVSGPLACIESSTNETDDVSVGTWPKDRHRSGRDLFVRVTLGCRDSDRSAMKTDEHVFDISTIPPAASDVKRNES